MTDSNASSENDDEVMDDVDADNDPDLDADHDAELDAEDDDQDENEDGDEEDGDEDENNDPNDTQMTATLDNTMDSEAVDTRDPDGGARTREGSDKVDGDGQARSPSPRKSATPGPTRWRSVIRPEVYTAKTYDVIPTMAAPQATSINAMAITPDLRYWMTGGSDGYIRKYSGIETINGKQLLTVAQRHPFVDSVVKAGALVSYWENEEAPSASGAPAEDHTLSPVYSLAVHSQALWLLSGTEAGGINLQSVRHDEGKRITCLKQHTSAVSALTLAPDERSVLSGSWDKKILDWDLDTGDIIRSYEGSGQISAVERRPASGAPFPAGALDEPVGSDTFSSDDRKGLANGVGGGGEDSGLGGEAAGDVASPAHESLFGGSDAGSLFGETMGGGFGGDEDDEFSHALGMSLEGDSMNGGGEGGDVTMGGVDGMNTGTDSAPEAQGGSIGTAEASGDAGNSSALPNATETDPAFSAAQPDTQTTVPPTSQENPDTTANPPLDAPAESSEQDHSPTILTSQTPTHHDPTQVSDSTFLSASIDGTIRIWDRRAPHAVARITPQRGVPPWCMAACWSPSGNTIYAGRRNGVIEEFDVHKASRNWAPTRSLRFPAVSGAVSAIRPMPNGRHLMCASHDILRLYDLEHPAAGAKDREGKTKGTGSVPFLIVPGPPRAGVISALWIDPTCRFMVSAAGTRGWEGTSTEALIGYEISVP